MRGSDQSSTWSSARRASHSTRSACASDRRSATSATSSPTRFADAGADAAIVNSGGIRGDRIYPAGPLTRRTLVALHPFGNVVCTLRVTGRTLLAALNHGVSKLPASNGAFPQVSGLTFTIDQRAAADRRAADVRVGGAPLDLAKRYTLAIPDYILKGGDGYTMFADAEVIVAPEAGDLIASAIEKYVAAKREIAPQVEGRITAR